MERRGCKSKQTCNFPTEGGRGGEGGQFQGRDFSLDICRGSIATAHVHIIDESVGQMYSDVSIMGFLQLGKVPLNMCSTAQFHHLRSFCISDARKCHKFNNPSHSASLRTRLEFLRRALFVFQLCVRSSQPSIHYGFKRVAALSSLTGVGASR